MPCYGCGASFGTFKKEKGCKNCGFAFCSKCLTHKTKIPKLNDETHHVCLKCFNILTGKVKPSEEKVSYDLPANFVKRVEALKEREASGHKPAAPAGPSTTKPKGQYKGMSKADIDIAQRLEKLREKTPQEVAASKVSNNEIGERLAGLKGINPSVYTTPTKPVYHPPERRTQQEQLDDLLLEISEEVDIEAKLPDSNQQIAARLAKLRDNPASTRATGDKNNTDLSAADNDENNLNKASVRDSATFSQNISETDKTDQTGSQSPASDKPNNAGTQEGEVSTEELNKILNEAAEELERDAQKAMRDLEQDKEIMKKLQEVKQRRKESHSDVNKDEKDQERSDSENEEETDEAATDRIVKQFVEESKLDEAAAQAGVEVEAGSSSKQKKKKKEEEEWVDEDELPYCCICTEDATVRCYDCDRDLYCNTCYKEGHRDLGLEDHRTVKYIPPKTAT